ncbi:hypothetical protein Tco_1258858 [Tanacetum coccineum]
MLRAFPMPLTGAASRWLRNKPSGSITTWENLKTEFLSKYCPPARTAKKMEEINNFQQEPNKNLYQAWERFKELLIKCPQHYLTEMQEVVLFYNGLDVLTRQILDSRGAIPSKTAAYAKVAIQEMAEYSENQHNGTFKDQKYTTQGITRLSIKSISTIVEADSYPIRRMGSSQYVVSTEQNSYYKASHINNSIPRKEKDPGSFTLPCFINNVCFDNALSDLGTSVSVMPLSTYLTLGLGELAHTKLTVELADKTMKYPKGIVENVLVGEVFEEFRARNDARMVSKISGYPNDCDHDKKIRIDCANNLKTKWETRNNVVGALMNTPIFVGTFSILTDFAVLEDMDACRDEGMGDGPNMSEMRRWKNGSHAGTLACMRWNEEKLKK